MSVAEKLNEVKSAKIIELIRNLNGTPEQILITLLIELGITKTDDLMRLTGLSFERIQNEKEIISRTGRGIEV